MKKDRFNSIATSVTCAMIGVGSFFGVVVVDELHDVNEELKLKQATLQESLKERNRLIAENTYFRKEAERLHDRLGQIFNEEYDGQHFFSKRVTATAYSARKEE